MRHALSEELRFTVYISSRSNDSARTEEGRVQLAAEFVTADRKSPFFMEPRLVLDFGGHRTYRIEPQFLQILELAARAKDGRFMLNMNSEWISASDVKRILVWLWPWLQRLQGADVQKEPIIVSGELHEKYRLKVERHENGVWLVYFASEAFGMAPWTPEASRRWARLFQRAANLADYLNIEASKNLPADPPSKEC